MQLASANGIKSIAFPALGCGIYRYPIEEACKIAVSEVVNALNNKTCIEKVVFSCIDSGIKKYLEDALKKHLTRCPESLNHYTIYCCGMARR